MAKIKTAEEVLKGLGITQKATIAFDMWQPWVQDDEHENDPQGFIGTYVGYKLASKSIGGKVNVFDLFAFDSCKPASPSGSGFVVASSYMLEELKRVKPGTRVAIIFTGSEKNVHGGQTPNLEWYFENPLDKGVSVASNVLPPSNAERISVATRLLPSAQINGQGNVIDGDVIS